MQSMLLISIAALTYYWSIMEAGTTLSSIVVKLSCKEETLTHMTTLTKQSRLSEGRMYSRRLMIIWEIMSIYFRVWTNCETDWRFLRTSWNVLLILYTFIPQQTGWSLVLMRLAWQNMAPSWPLSSLAASSSWAALWKSMKRTHYTS